jgi:hypothetical protein
MKIVLATDSTNAEFNGDCDYGFIDLTPALAKMVLSLMADAIRLNRSHQSVHELHCWNGSVRYFRPKHEGNLEKHLPGTEDIYSVLPGRHRHSRFELSADRIRSPRRGGRWFRA